MKIKHVFDFNLALSQGAYAWPGGYPCYFICSDGATLSFEAARENAGLIRDAIISKADKQWEVVAFDVNWEDTDLYCSHTNEKIQSAYGDD